MSARTASDYAGQLRQLLPRGAAWQVPPGGVLDRVLAGLAEEFARIDARADALLDEADPRTTLELLPDWERVAGLPDSCTGAPEETYERQVALHQKLTGIGGQNRAAFVELGARLGYAIEIEEHRPFRVGDRIGVPVNGPDWAFAWTVLVRPFEGVFEEGEFLAHFRAGDPVERRLVGFGQLDVECIISRAAPAHTTVLFAYEVEPEPVLWIDLI